MCLDRVAGKYDFHSVRSDTAQTLDVPRAIYGAVYFTSSPARASEPRTLPTWEGFVLRSTIIYEWLFAKPRVGWWLSPFGAPLQDLASQNAKCLIAQHLQGLFDKQQFHRHEATTADRNYKRYCLQYSTSVLMSEHYRAFIWSSAYQLALVLLIYLGTLGHLSSFE